LPQPPVKIVYLPPQPQHLLRCAMQPVNLHSYIAAKETFVFVWLLQNVYQVSVILFRLAHL
jgi:hypothetical protein